MRGVIIVPVIVVALRSFTRKLDELLEKLDITLKTTLLGTATILRKVPE